MQLKALKTITNTQTSSQNGSEIDLQSDTTSCHTVSLVDESTIKELIQEYNYEIQNNPFLNLRNNKLDTLREEEDMYSVFENYDMAETVSIQDISHNPITITNFLYLSNHIQIIITLKIKLNI